MVILINQYSVRPDKAAAYAQWAQKSIPQLIGAPGIVELSSFRNVTGDSQVTVFFQFSDLDAFAKWRANEDVDRIFTESWEYMEDFHAELLGPSPILPEPLRAG